MTIEAQTTDQNAPTGVEHDEDAFLAGFNADGGEVPTPAETPVEKEEESRVEPEGGEAGALDTPDEEGTPPEPATPATDEPVMVTMAQLTAAIEDLKAANDAAIRKAFGKIGEVEGIVKHLRAGRSQPAKVKLEPKSLKRIAEEYPALAEMLAEDLNDNWPSTESAAPDGEELLTSIQPKIDARAEEIAGHVVERVLLSREHPDWETVAGSEDFSKWAAQQPPEVRKVLDDSWSHTEIGEVLTSYKAAIAAKTEAEAKTLSDKRARLERAVVPVSGRENPPKVDVDEETAFLEGFNS